MPRGSRGRASAAVCCPPLITDLTLAAVAVHHAGAVFGGPAAFYAHTRRRCRLNRRPLPAWLVCLVSLVAGLLLGCNLALERVRM